MATTETSVPKTTIDEPWYAGLPSPTTTARSITRAHLLSWMKKDKLAGKDFVLVDLRRTDYEGGSIRGSINLPAQSLYHTIPTLYKLFLSAGITTVIWFCTSSRGRGTRAAGWFADFIQAENNIGMESCILEGGVRGWATAGEEYVKMMDDYEAAFWQ